jgi:uncharacterized membrane protein
MNASSNSNNNLYALLTYPIPLVGVIILISDSMKNDPFLRTHAVQSIALGVVLGVLSIVLNIVLPLISCVVPLVALGLTIYYGLQANQGKAVTIPFITDFCRNQKWI